MQAKSAGLPFKRFSVRKARIAFHERRLAFASGASAKDCALYWVRFDKLLKKLRLKATLSTSVRGSELSKLAVVVDGAQPLPTLLLRGRKKTAAKSKCPCARSESIGRIRFRPNYAGANMGHPSRT
jgi:hypothetical protein